jgi:hypothetical protein
LWKQEDNPETRTGQQIKSYFSSRSVLSWVWRFVLVWILFYILTMIISIVALPFTGKYLVDPLNTLGMVVPDMGTLFAITQFRSLIYMLVTLPLIIFWINATWFICGETAKMHLKAFEGSPALFGEYKAMQLKQSNVDSDPAARGKPMKGSIPQFDG